MSIMKELGILQLKQAGTSSLSSSLSSSSSFSYLSAKTNTMVIRTLESPHPQINIAIDTSTVTFLPIDPRIWIHRKFHDND